MKAQAHHSAESSLLTRLADLGKSRIKCANKEGEH